MLLPFVAPVAMIVLAVNSNLRLPVVGLVAAGRHRACRAAIDRRRRPVASRLVELAIAGAGALPSVAAFAGRYRGVPAPVAVARR